jgi:16S rRNA (uracil1498-N3)-methyltransferase
VNGCCFCGGVFLNCLLFSQDDFIPGTARVRLDDRRFVHLRDVLKVGVGSEITAGVIDGKLGTAAVREITSGGIELEVSLHRNPPPPLPLTLILALPRPKTLRKALHAATTLGIKRIFIIQSWRVDKGYWSSPLLTPAALERILVLGLEQAVDTAMPAVHFFRRFRPFVEDRIPQLIRGTHPILAHPGAPQNCPKLTNTPLSLAVGPEGGFNSYEVAMFRRQGFEPVGIGPRLLRVEEALPALAGKLAL